jgi:hypothetical protein
VPVPIQPGIGSDFRPVQGREDFHQLVQAAQPFSPFIDLVPDAWASGINITTIRAGTTAGTVSQSFGAFHRADEGCFLQETISAHPAAEEGAFQSPFDGGYESIEERFMVEGIVCRLPAPARGKSGQLVIL